MAWITFTSVSVSNGGLTATVNSAEDISLLEINAGLIIGELAPVAIKKAYLGAGNSKVIELFAPWPHATQTNKPARVFNTDAGLPEATKALNDVTDLVKGDFQEVIVVADNIDKVVNVSNNMSAVIAAPAEAAKAKTEADRAATNSLSMTSMSQSQFEAIRAANNEEFAASGPVHLGKHESGKEVNPTKSGLYTALTTPNTLKLGKAGGVGDSKTDLSQLNIAGIQFYLDERSIKFPQAPDGKTTYNKSTGAIVTHVDSTTAFAAQQADPTNVEVVINRVDMWGFESWLEEVNTTNPFVYPNGLIQSQAATMDGVNTSSSARPVTYYAVFDGDTGSKGKGVNFFTLTDAQKKKVLGNHKNNLYYLDDGRLVQWRLRQRTIAGAGNGDWFNIESTKSSLLYDTSRKFVVAQGNSNTVVVFADAGGSRYVAPDNAGNVLVGGSDKAVFVPIAPSPAINGECYFIVCGTVSRLNQGLYHPSLNPNGSAKALGDTFWHNTAQSFTTTADCFNPAKLLAGSGSIASGKSGRPSGENQYFDAIYASGFGGVCRDMRHSANGLTPTDFAEADQMVKNGTYRGFEKAVFTKLVNVVAGNLNEGGYVSGINGTGSSGYITNYGGTSLPIFRQNSYLFEPITKTLCKTKGLDTDKSEVTIPISAITGVVENLRYPAKLIHVIVDKLPSSIGGSFLQTDIIGSPERILATPQLANGWQGSWLPWIPNNTASPAQTRKILSIHNQVYSDNNGASWTNGVWGFNPATNAEGAGGAVPANLVIIRPYQAFAKQTKHSPNAAVYGELGDAYAVTSHDKANGCLLAESATGLILKNNTGISQNTKSLLTKAVDSTGKPTSSATTDGIAYSALTLAAPDNASAGFKCVNYPTASNQQGFINYAYTELKHNGTNWGDDSKVTIVDNQSTKTDLNGNTVLVGTAQTCESLGWIKNKL